MIIGQRWGPLVAQQTWDGREEQYFHHDSELNFAGNENNKNNDLNLKFRDSENFWFLKKKLLFFVSFQWSKFLLLTETRVEIGETGENWMELRFKLPLVKAPTDLKWEPWFGDGNTWSLPECSETVLYFSVRRVWFGFAFAFAFAKLKWGRRAGGFFFFFFF